MNTEQTSKNILRTINLLYAYTESSFSKNKRSSTACENFWREITSWPGSFSYMRVDDTKYKTVYVDAK